VGGVAITNGIGMTAIPAGALAWCRTWKGNEDAAMDATVTTAGAARGLDETRGGEAEKTSGSSKGFPTGVGGERVGDMVMEAILPEIEAAPKGENIGCSFCVWVEDEGHG